MNPNRDENSPRAHPIIVCVDLLVTLTVLSFLFLLRNPTAQQWWCYNRMSLHWYEYRCVCENSYFRYLTCHLCDEQQLRLSATTHFVCEYKWAVVSPPSVWWWWAADTGLSISMHHRFASHFISASHENQWWLVKGFFFFMIGNFIKAK